MRINNSKVKNTILTAYFMLLFAVIMGMIIFGLFKTWIENSTMKYGVFIVFFILLFLVLHKVAKYFEYDSDGHVLVIINRGFVISEYIKYGEKKAEFPKEKLLYYKLNKHFIFYKSLNLYIKSGEHHQKRLKFNVTLVSNKKLKYLRMSLDKVVKQNKANR